MDAATNAIIGPWAQFGVWGSVTIALGVVVLFLYRSNDKRTEAHMAAVQKCHDTTLDITVKQIESQNRMSEALDGNSTVMKAALEALKR